MGLPPLERVAVSSRFLRVLFMLGLGGALTVQAEPWSLLVVVGAPGEPQYAEALGRQAQTWERTALQGGHRVTVIGTDEDEALSDQERLRLALLEEAGEGSPWLWVILLGHGTFDGHQARFNLRGPDLAATDLAGWLDRIRRPVIVLNAASASAPFMKVLAATNRLVVTATRSGFEQNYARFGEFIAECFGDPTADLDKDEQVSLLEAFVVAGNRVEEFYRTEGRLMTEHALLDDNGDGWGTPADWFRGVRVIKHSEKGDPPDGVRAHQVHLLPSAAERALPAELRAQRDTLVMEVAQLRARREAMAEADYFDALERVLVRLARLYEQVEADSETTTDPGPQQP